MSESVGALTDCNKARIQSKFTVRYVPAEQALLQPVTDTIPDSVLKIPWFKYPSETRLSYCTPEPSARVV